MENEEKNINLLKKTVKINKKIEKTNKLIEALKLKALGFLSEEVIEEYSLDENNEEKLIKKKVTKKNIPPDISAVKVLLELDEQENSIDLESMTNQEIEQKIDDIIKKIKEIDKNDN